MHRPTAVLLLLPGLLFGLPAAADDEPAKLQQAAEQAVQDVLEPLKFEQAEVEQAVLTPTATPAHAAAMAWVDLQTIPPARHEFVRYIWVPPTDEMLKFGEEEDAQELPLHKLQKQVTNLVVNEVVSELGNPLLVEPVETGNGTLLRYDLQKLAPREIAGAPDVLRLLRTWEKLGEDEPWFHTRQVIDEGRTAAIIAVAEAEVKTGTEVLQTLPRGTEVEILDERDGWLRIGDGWVLRDHIEIIKEEVKVFPLNPAGGQALISLAEATNSQVPIVHVGYFYNRVLQTLNGGLYYEFTFPREFRKRTVVNALLDEDFTEQEFSQLTDETVYLLLYGASRRLVAAIRSDQRAGLFRSQVTGKPRAVEVFSGAGGRASVNQGLITRTQDMSDADRDARTHPIRELLNQKYAATELIPERINGLHGFALFAGNNPPPGIEAGSLQTSVPDNIARDHTIPPPFTARLQPAIGCYRCHNRPQVSRGYIPFKNDVQTMLNNSDLDVFGERTDGQPNLDTLSRVAGLYKGQHDKPLRRARDDYSDAVLVATRGLPTTLAYTTIARTFNEYTYNLVTPQVACRELGFEVTEGKPSLVLRRLIPRLPPDELGIQPEDPIIGALKAGLSVNRLEWEQVYPDAFYRSTASLQEIVNHEDPQDD